MGFDASKLQGGKLDHLLDLSPRLRGVVRSSLLTLNTPIAKKRFQRLIDENSKPLWLEIGGRQPRDGWIVTNVGPTCQLYMDATRKWPIDTASVEYIYSDNVIEHLTLEQGRVLFQEARRCLKPGGVLRLVTPDIRAHVEMYLNGRESLQNEVSRHYRSAGLTVEHPVDLVRVPIAAFGHHVGYLYDYETLASELTKAGFTNVRRCELGESEHAPLQNLDLRSDQNRAQLAVEATASP